MSNPWLRPLPTPGRIVNIGNQSDLNSWLSNPQNNDVVEWGDGVVCGGFINVYRDNVVIRGHGHSRFDGMINQQGKNFWTINMHVVNINAHCMNQYFEDDAIVNCVLEGDGVTVGSVGVGSWSQNNQLIYGSVIRGKQDAIYAQNGPTGIKYVVQNYLGDVAPGGNSWTLHAYTESPDKSDLMYFIQNVFANGRCLLGGQAGATLPLYNLFQENWFDRADLILNYKRPMCCDLIGNRFYNCSLDFIHFQGVSSESQPPPDEWSIVTGNKHWRSDGGYHFRFRTSAYFNGAREEGTSRIRTIDIWNNNEYYGTFRASFYADNVNVDPVTSLNQFSSLTEAAGKRFDNNSVSIVGSPQNEYWIIQNDFDADRAMLVCFGENTVQFPRPAKVASVEDPFDFFFSPNATLGEQGMLTTWLVRYQPAVCDAEEARRLINEAIAKSHQKGVKNRLRAALKSMEGC